MKSSEPTFTIGVEEKYMMVDKESHPPIAHMTERKMLQLNERCRPQAKHNTLLSQIEITT